MGDEVVLRSIVEDWILTFEILNLFVQSLLDPVYAYPNTPLNRNKLTIFYHLTSLGLGRTMVCIEC